MRQRRAVFRSTGAWIPQEDSVTVRSASTGETVGTSQEDVDRLLSGLTEAGYRNTISIEQLKAAADGALSEALKKRVAGLSLSGATSLDVSATINSLKEKKQELSAAIDQDAADRFQEIFQEICQIEDRLKDLGDKPDLLEKEAGELTEALEAEEAKVRELDALYKEKTAALDAHTMSKIRDTDIYQERLHDAFDAHRPGLQGDRAPREAVPADPRRGIGLSGLRDLSAFGPGDPVLRTAPLYGNPLPPSAAALCDPVPGGLRHLLPGDPDPSDPLQARRFRL